MRQWLKLWTKALNDGISTELTLTEFGLWCRLLMLAATSPVDGTISNGKRAFSERELSERLHVNRQTLRTFLHKCVEQGRIRITDKGIELVNWLEYQAPWEEVQANKRRTAAKEHARAPQPKPRKPDPQPPGYWNGEPLFNDELSRKDKR